MKDGYYRIKTWEAMEKEFGYHSVDGIDCEHVFTIEMRDSLPNNRIIQVVDNRWTDNLDCNWAISMDMVEVYIGKDLTIPKEENLPLDRLVGQLVSYLREEETHDFLKPFLVKALEIVNKAQGSSQD